MCTRLWLLHRQFYPEIQTTRVCRVSCNGVNCNYCLPEINVKDSWLVSLVQDLLLIFSLSYSLKPNYICLKTQSVFQENQFESLVQV